MSLRTVVRSKQSYFGAFGTGDELKPMATKPKVKGKGKDTADLLSDGTMAPSSSLASSIIQGSRKRPADQAGLNDSEGG